jgi:hypothetical protein|tara:strand:+ start:28 stop:513 length:486 start_codon:yes stop_codon:yes gene_type:complete
MSMSMSMFHVSVGVGAAAGAAAAGSTSPLQLAEALGAFRDQVRRGAIEDQKRARQPPAEGEATEPLPEELLRLCDALRDEVLPSLGVRLEDRSKGAAAQLTLDDPDIVMAEVHLPNPNPNPNPIRHRDRHQVGRKTHSSLLTPHAPHSSLLTPHSSVLTTY